MHFNVYLRKDGRYEGRLPREKKSDGKRQFLYLFVKTLDEVHKK